VVGGSDINDKPVHHASGKGEVRKEERGYGGEGSDCSPPVMVCPGDTTDEVHFRQMLSAMSST